MAIHRNSRRASSSWRALDVYARSTGPPSVARTRQRKDEPSRRETVAGPPIDSVARIRRLIPSAWRPCLQRPAGQTDRPVFSKLARRQRQPWRCSTPERSPAAQRRLAAVSTPRDLSPTSPRSSPTLADGPAASQAASSPSPGGAAHAPCLDGACAVQPAGEGRVRLPCEQDNSSQSAPLPDRDRGWQRGSAGREGGRWRRDRREDQTGEAVAARLSQCSRAEWTISTPGVYLSEEFDAEPG